MRTQGRRWAAPVQGGVCPYPKVTQGGVCVWLHSGQLGGSWGARRQLEALLEVTAGCHLPSQGTCIPEASHWG